MNVGIRFGLKIVVVVEQVVKAFRIKPSIETIITKNIYNQQNIKIPNHNYILRYTKVRKKRREKKKNR